MLAAILNEVHWGALYVASEWLVRIAALLYVPQRRPPSAARAWLLLILFLPWVGVVLYLLIGRAYMPRRRLHVQRRIYELIRELAPRPGAFESRAAGVVSPELLPALRLADRLSEFPLIEGNRFELLPCTPPRSAASLPISMLPSATCTCFSTFSRTTRRDARSPPRSSALHGAASPYGSSATPSARAPV
jgi:hypothetical protein